MLTKYCAVITNPGAPSRKGETAAIEPAVAEFYPPDKIFHKSTRYAGGRRRDDVRRYLLCRALRAHQLEGVKQLANILEPFGCKVVGVPLTEVLHLKTGVVYLENGVMLTAGEFCTNSASEGYTKITVPKDEPYAKLHLGERKVINAKGIPKY